MNEIENTKKVIETKVSSFLSGKPIWFWWLAYFILTALLFGIFYFVLYVLTVKWWIIALLLVIIGIVWGTIAYVNRNKNEKSGS